MLMPLPGIHMNRSICIGAIASLLWLGSAGVAAQSVEAPASVAASSPAASAPAKTPCDALAADKKLTGAARASFLKKCDDDASNELRAACDTKAAEQKLSATAKRDFVKRCIADGKRL
jgi:hypothetical protein